MGRLTPATRPVMMVNRLVPFACLLQLPVAYRMRAILVLMVVMAPVIV